MLAGQKPKASKKKMTRKNRTAALKRKTLRRKLMIDNAEQALRVHGGKR
jgi:hypothetical protein